jgi:hypothetical protein
MAGQQVVQHLPVRLGDLAVQQGGGGDHEHAAELGCGLGQGLVEQDTEVAVADPAGLESLTKGVGAKTSHPRRAPSHRMTRPQPLPITFATVRRHDAW